MSEAVVIIVEPNEAIGNIFSQHLADVPCRCIVLHDPRHLDAAVRAEPPTLVLLDIMATVHDEQGPERPLWQSLAARPLLPFLTLCFSRTSSTPTDTPLFSAPSETITVASPQDYRGVARLIGLYLALFERQPYLVDALAGTLLPSVHGSIQEFSFEDVLKLIEQGGHTGLLLLRDGVATGIVACEDGQIVHAMSGPLVGREAFTTLYLGRNAQFFFFTGVQLGEHSITHDVNNLILEASRMGDEVTDITATMPPNASIRRVKGYTDQLPGKRLSMLEWEILSVVDRYHIVRELLRRSHHPEFTVMRTLRSLMNRQLIEVVPAEDVAPPRVIERV